MGWGSNRPLPLCYMNNKLLVICPSRKRYEGCRSLIESFLKTTCNSSKLIICVDNDDNVVRYHNVINSFNSQRVNMLVQHRMTLTEIINGAWKNITGYDYYCVVNDDMTFETEGWDEKLCVPYRISTGIEPNAIKKWGRYYRGFPVAGFPFISVIDSRILNALGWLQYPELKGCCGDNVWYWIGRRLEILYLDSTVVYRHNHFYFGESEMDDTYQEDGDMDSYMKKIKEDHKIFMNWLKYKINDSLERVKPVIKEIRYARK